MDQIGQQQVERLVERLAIMYKRSDSKKLLSSTGITSLTFRRWIGGESLPQKSSLKAILQNCSEEDRGVLLPIFKQLYPNEEVPDENIAAIPIEFYDKVIKALAETPTSLRYQTICFLVLRHILQHLDADRKGMKLRVFHCVKLPEGVVSCLRQDVEMETAVQDLMNEKDQVFFGEESIAGQALSAFKPRLSQEDDNKCIIALPLLREGKIGGCLQAECSTLSDIGQKRLREYVNLLALSIDPDKFYEKEAISLVIMPPVEDQYAYLLSLPAQKIDLMKAKHFTKKQAEDYILYQTVAYLSQKALE